MKKALSLLTVLLFSIPVFAQVDNKALIELGKNYRQFMFRNEPPEDILAEFKKYENTELSFTAEFIKQTLTTNNKLISDRFLTRPSDKDLKYIHVVELVNYNVRKETPEDNDKLVADHLSKEAPVYELLSDYYSMLFNGYGNKVKPFDLSNVNFNLNKLGLQNETEKGIFFLEAMKFNGTLIWGYINIVKPPRYDEALKFIDKYPKFNGSPYYQYLDLNFPDFEKHIQSQTKTESYKEFYINKYYDTLLSHLESLRELGKGEEPIRDLLLGSILKEKVFYKYSKKEKELKKLFTEVKK